MAVDEFWSPQIISVMVSLEGLQSPEHLGRTDEGVFPEAWEHLAARGKAYGRSGADLRKQRPRGRNKEPRGESPERASAGCS